VLGSNDPLIITLDTYSHVLLGLQAAAAEALDSVPAEPRSDAV
jgi:hypothetical protein